MAQKLSLFSRHAEPSNLSFAKHYNYHYVAVKNIWLSTLASNGAYDGVSKARHFSFVCHYELNSVHLSKPAGLVSSIFFPVEIMGAFMFERYLQLHWT